jgi:hypothetical protein
MARKTFYIPDGIPNIETLFTDVYFKNVVDYFIVAKDDLGEIIATTRINELGCCCIDDKVRIHFVNSLGEIDSINFGRPEEIGETKSDSWESALRFPLDKTKGGSLRQNIKSNETIEAETKCYTEMDQYWVKEVFNTKQAWIETFLPNGFNEPSQKEFVPIEILDGKYQIRKSEKRYEYVVRIKFAMANTNINLR